MVPLGKTVDNSTGAYDGLLGMTHEVPGLYSGENIRCRLVENAASIALAKGRVVTYKSGLFYKHVDGYINVLNEKAAGQVDPTLGVSAPVGHVFWILERGITLLKATISPDAEALWSADDLLGAAIAAATTGITAGYVAAQVIAGATSPLALGVANAFARAISANTTTQTGRDVLAYMDVK
jgi:hypothetical protein